MKTKVFRAFSILILTAVYASLSGCVTETETTGFFTDYSHLRVVTSDSIRFINLAALKDYKKFIIDPVKVHFHSQAQAIEAIRTGEMTLQNLEDMSNYMHDTVVKSVSDGYKVVYQSGKGVARVRIALTDLKKSDDVLKSLPRNELASLGLGAVSMEAELIDSVTGEQIGAVVESQTGNTLTLESKGEWSDAKAIMDQWAGRFKERLDEVHGH
ncbi:MAG: DUF3313 domain-containing protein [Planctomycetota bacterium]